MELKTSAVNTSQRPFGTTVSPDREVDAELAQHIGDGDQEALALLVDRHLGPLYKYLRRRLGAGHDELIYKVVLASFDDVLKRLPRYTLPSNAAPLRFRLFALANRHLGRLGKKSPVLEATSEPPDLLALRASMAGLPSRHQASLCFALFEEMHPQEIASALGLGLPGAMRLLRSALRRVARKLTDPEGAHDA